MKKKAVDGVECEYRADFVHVVPATIYMLMSQGFEKTGIPERAAATGLHLFESLRDIVGQFSSEPSPVVQEFMPPEKPWGGVGPIEKTIQRGQPVRQAFGVKIVQLTNSLGKDASWRHAYRIRLPHYPHVGRNAAQDLAVVFNKRPSGKR
jgi:hypothetical protein